MDQSGKLTHYIYAGAKRSTKTPTHARARGMSFFADIAFFRADGTVVAIYNGRAVRGHEY